jgi:hypothetical protein
MPERRVAVTTRSTRLDGRTRLARAVRRFEAYPTRETAERLVRLLSPANGRPWKMSDAVERTGVPRRDSFSRSFIVAKARRPVTASLPRRDVIHNGVPRLRRLSKLRRLSRS